MRFPASILSLLLAAILSCASIAAASAQDRPEADGQQDVRQIYDSISFAGRTDLEISDPALVPRQLAFAAEQSGCVYKYDIEVLPIHFISTENRRLALVFCRFGMTGSHQAFDFVDLDRPKLMQFPFIAQPNGFGTTASPGRITWKRETGVFEAETKVDVCPSWQLRHTYRLGLNEGWVSHAASFVIVRVEVRQDRCGQDSAWATTWEATPWPESVDVR